MTTDSLAPTPEVATTFCPTCEPERDPVAEVLATFYCGFHQPVVAGRDDDAVSESQEYMSSSEAGGQSNRDFCAFIHRGIAPPRGPR